MLSLARLSKEKIRENQGEFSAVAIRPRSQLCAFSSPHMRKRKRELVLKRFFTNQSETCPKSAPKHGSATSVFGITRLRQLLDEVVHLLQYLGLVRLEDIMPRILQSDHPC